MQPQIQISAPALAPAPAPKPDRFTTYIENYIFDLSNRFKIVTI
jgi:hypothetical protein